MSEDIASGCTKAIAFIGLIASLIAICTFLTGIMSIPQAITTIFATPILSPTNPATKQATEVYLSSTPTINSTKPSVYQEPGTWQLSGLEEKTIGAIVSTRDGTTYVATAENRQGIFRKNDEEVEWVAVNNGLGELEIYDLVMSFDESIIYAIGESNTWSSNNGGKSWSVISDFESMEQVTPIALASTDGRIIYGVAQYNQTFRSSDYGQTWNKVADKGPCDRLEAILANEKLFCIRGEPLGRGIAAYGWNGTVGGVYKAENQGAKWYEAAAIGAKSVLTRIVIEQKNPDQLFVCTDSNGVYKSTDGGGSWTPINNTLPNQGHDLNCRSLILDPEEKMIYAAFLGYGVFATPISSDNWQDLTADLSQQVKESISTMEVNKENLLLGTDGSGLWVSTVQ